MSIKSLLTTGAALLAAASIGQAAAEYYKIDPTHSGVNFKIRHFFSKVPGGFNDFNGVITLDPDDPTKNEVYAVMAVKSVDTNNDRRDNHLRSGDYFDAAKWPTMTFRSTKWEKTDNEKEFKVIGNLNMMGQTHPVVLEVEFLGKGPGGRGAILTGWSAEGTLDRTEWGQTAGGPALGEEVEIEISIEAQQMNETEVEKFKKEEAERKAKEKEEAKKAAA